MEVTYRDVVKRLVTEGWLLDRQSGSHAVYVHTEKEGIVVVAGKPGADIPKGTLNAIKKQAGWK